MSKYFIFNGIIKNHYVIINREDRKIYELTDCKYEDTTSHCKSLYKKDESQDFCHPKGNYLGTSYYMTLNDGIVHGITRIDLILETNEKKKFTDKLNEIEKEQKEIIERRQKYYERLNKEEEEVAI